VGEGLVLKIEFIGIMPPLFCGSDSLQVTDCGEILGIWIPAMAKSVPVDFEEHARKDSAAAMPVSFATLLREGKNQ